MKKVGISTDEQLKLHNIAKAELNRLLRIYSDDRTLDLLNRFKNKFNLCESVYKVILEEHQKAKGKKIERRNLKVAMTQVPHALSFAGYSFNKDLLNELFGSTSQKGRTVKKLRDAITHSIDDKAVEEIKQRETELFGYMDDFLSVIETS